MASSAFGRPFPLGRQPWRTLDPFLFCAYHNDAFPSGQLATLGPSAAELRGRDLTMDFSYKDGWSMYHGTTIPGFPAHPHFGFETVTLAMKGVVDHFDSLGATGRYGNGDVQWLTTGGGVQHSEMFPLLNDQGNNPLELFQLWLNLPQAKKQSTPYFEMFWAPEVPVISSGDADITVVAGSLASASPKVPPPDSWAAAPENEVAIWIVRIKGPTGSVSVPAAKFGAAINRTLYFYKGDADRVAISNPTVPGTIALQVSQGLQVDASVPLMLRAEGGCAEVLVLQGRPIKERVVQRGPFVTTSQDELMSVVAKYHATEFGGWPWPSPDHHHPREQPRFALRPGAAAKEYPPS